MNPFLVNGAHAPPDVLYDLAREGGLEHGRGRDRRRLLVPGELAHQHLGILQENECND